MTQEKLTYADAKVSSKKESAEKLYLIIIKSMMDEDFIYYTWRIFCFLQNVSVGGLNSSGNILKSLYR